eukprot:scaffold157725_cov25-Tisochrysis_lutea.AAC.1
MVAAAVLGDQQGAANALVLDAGAVGLRARAEALGTCKDQPAMEGATHNMSCLVEWTGLITFILSDIQTQQVKGTSHREGCNK